MITVCQQCGGLRADHLETFAGTPCQCMFSPDLCSLKRLNGYRAASIAVENLLEDAASKLPKRLGGHDHLAAYKEGYYIGLLLAHSQLALGEFPEHNVTTIEMILAQNNENLYQL